MHHGPAVKLDADYASAQKAKLGIWLFFFYSFVYAIFVYIGVADSDLLGEKVLGGQTLGVVYGFGLIILAILLGLIYNHICTKLEDKLNLQEKLDKENKENK